MQELLAYACLTCGICEPSWFDATGCSMLALDGIERCVGVRPVFWAGDNVLMLCVLKQRLFSLSGYVIGQGMAITQNAA